MAETEKWISKSGIFLFFTATVFRFQPVPGVSFGVFFRQEEDILVVILESASLGKEVPGAVLGVWACGKVNPSFKRRCLGGGFKNLFMFIPTLGK